MAKKREANSPNYEALIIPFFAKQRLASPLKGEIEALSIALGVGDFQGNRGEVLCVYPKDAGIKRLILLGLGEEEKLTKEGLRRAYSSAIGAVKGKVPSLHVELPQTKFLSSTEVTEGASEGLFLTNYVFNQNRSKAEKNVERITFSHADSKSLKRAETVCRNVSFVRDLVMGNADDVTPLFLAEKGKELAKAHSKIKTTVFNRAQIQEMGMGLLYAVSRGATTEPVFMTIEYKGAPKSKERTALVGKGITFDTGGLNLKVNAGIETMRDDMAGAAAIIGTISAIAELGLPVNVVGVIAATENAIGSRSYKPGDVYKSHSGITVEIDNTDAEGRLVLADALSYAQKVFKPTRMVDIATLTGGVVVALGEEVSGLMSTSDSLSEQLLEAGANAFERLWRLPLYEEYEDLLKSKVADLKNAGVRKASPIQGGIFLKRFVEMENWAHLDIAGTAFRSPSFYHPVQATGIGVRLLVSFLEQLC